MSLIGYLKREDLLTILSLRPSCLKRSKTTESWPLSLTLISGSSHLPEYILAVLSLARFYVFQPGLEPGNKAPSKFLVYSNIVSTKKHANSSFLASISNNFFSPAQESKSVSSYLTFIFLVSSLQLPRNRYSKTPDQTSSLLLHLFQVHIICQLHVLGMDLKNFQASCSIRDSNIYLPVKATCETVCEHRQGSFLVQREEGIGLR